MMIKNYEELIQAVKEKSGRKRVIVAAAEEKYLSLVFAAAIAK